MVVKVIRDKYNLKSCSGTVIDKELLYLLITESLRHNNSEFLLIDISSGGYPCFIEQAGLTYHEVYDLNDRYTELWEDKDSDVIGDDSGDFAISIENYHDSSDVFGNSILIYNGLCYQVGDHI